MVGFLISAYITLAVAVIIVAAVAPGSISQKAMDTAKVFDGLSVAHRGLHNNDKDIPENSMAAFLKARENGYGVELDVHLTADNQLVVFHDYDISRTCRADKAIGSMTYEELSEYRLFDTDEHIPLFTEVLQALGDTPVIVEIKPAGARYAELCRRAYEVLCEHGTNWCIQSFDPRICGWFKRNAPDVFRGVLACRPCDYVGISKFSSAVLGNLLLNFIARPHYIAHKDGAPTPISKICMMMQPMKAVWTITDESDMPRVTSNNNIVIFEQYEPSPRFRQNEAC